MPEEEICDSCGRVITFEREKTRFYCFNCGKVLIRRCSICRKYGRPYECPKCGFVGP